MDVKGSTENPNNAGFPVEFELFVKFPVLLGFLSYFCTPYLTSICSNWYNVLEVFCRNTIQDWNIIGLLNFIK